MRGPGVVRVIGSGKPSGEIAEELYEARWEIRTQLENAIHLGGEVKVYGPDLSVDV